ncbi:MAG: YdeI/OmpD-associated family protein [Burkholderiaceae bacterium]
MPSCLPLREAVHAARPDVTETVKWRMPCFMLGGRILANMAAFKAHCAFGFWQGGAVAGADKAGEAMGQLGRITGPADLPSPARLQAMVRQAAKLVEQGTPARRSQRPATPKPPPELPDFLTAALRQHPEAARHFQAFPPSAQREYVAWLAEAKQAATRERRLAQALEWLAEGKRRNWKYENC